MLVACAYGVAYDKTTLLCRTVEKAWQRQKAYDWPSCQSPRMLWGYVYTGCFLIFN